MKIYQAIFTYAGTFPETGFGLWTITQGVEENAVIGQAYAQYLDLHNESRGTWSATAFSKMLKMNGSIEFEMSTNENIWFSVRMNTVNTNDLTHEE